ncbi:hypothetical protein HanXRQr2_Chr12g0534631 [Helianthus annuus]|uniref:Uncharacterized protein n=1 Tax=Helianthus annuus TaxID=4232 RepID=A0A251TCI9_HELAN|nr:uncharacterized protein LOC110890583 isoform X2 [Helianthus annuus]KAF5777355.1 hypothetical protein HanXRQr2_Chr12g0534631 [Helianthus annuus]KAJ0492529.1 hypothetical protein HanIR_Chr12g0575921 [Helianthus annuus]KAJ0862165.1 hypothetical protein HanPSC8_Chr12g0514951 [Helianthus annuus]
MLNKSTISSSKLTTQPNLPKPSTADAQLTFWPPSAAAVDALVFKLKAKDGDSEANWEKIILNFKKEIEQQDEQLNYTQSSGDGGERREKVRAKFSVPLSRKEMEKDFEDMGERRLPRKPKKRPRVIQNHLDTLFPGLWLTEIHADLYRVSETKKR